VGNRNEVPHLPKLNRQKPIEWIYRRDVALSLQDH